MADLSPNSPTSATAALRKSPDPKISVMRQQLAQVKDAAQKRPLREDDLAPVLACLADPLSLETLAEHYIDCLRTIAKVGQVGSVLALATHLCNYVASPSSPRAIAASAKGIVQSFHTIFEDFHARAPAGRDDESLALLVNTVFAKLIDSIKPENVVVVTTVLMLLQRFASVPVLQSKLQAMMHCKDYFCFELLGSGQFSDVYKACHKLAGKLVAVKKMKYLNVSETIQKALKREVQVMKNMNSPAIIKLYDSFQIDQYLFIVMEYSPLGDLETQLKKRGKGFDLDEVSHFMTEIAVGLRVLRSKSIMHRDLKPANILLFPEPQAPFGVKLKLCDFTMARELVAGELAKTLCGSPLYMAPEVLNRQKYTDKADLWSVGVIMYRLLFQRLPYTGLNEWDLRENINSKELELPREIPDTTRDLLIGLLQKDALVRMSWEEFFTHPFLSREVMNEVPIEDPAQQISELQHRLKEYAEKLGKASLMTSKLQKEVEESRHREVILRQMHDEERKNSDKRMKDLEEQLIEVKAKLEAKLKESLALTGVSASSTSSSSSSGMSATGNSDLMEVSGNSGLRMARNLRNSAPANVSGIAAAAAAEFDQTVAAGELLQYKSLFEATLEENNRLNKQLRESAMVEQLLRNEMHQKDEKVRELQQMEGVFQEQMRILESELTTKEDRIQVLEGRFKELEAYRLQLQQQQAQLAQQQQQQQHLATNGHQPQFSPLVFSIPNGAAHNGAAGQLSPPVSPLNSINHSPIQSSMWIHSQNGGGQGAANSNAPPPYPGGPAR